MRPAADHDAAIWWQRDAAYLYRWADTYRHRGRPADPWVATKVQNNAAHSAARARATLGIEPLLEAAS